MSAIRCLIFDCDDTLVESEYLCNLAMQQHLADYGVSEDVGELCERYRAWKLADIFADLAMRHGLVLEIDHETRYRNRQSALLEAQLTVVPGVPEMLAALHIPVCVASNGPYGKIAQTMRITRLDRFFNRHYFSAYDIGSWKPNPELFLHAAAGMGVPPEACAVIEDSPIGVEAARRAGMRAFLYDPRGIHAAGHATVFGEMEALPALLLAAEQVGVPA